MHFLRGRVGNDLVNLTEEYLKIGELVVESFREDRHFDQPITGNDCAVG